MLELGRVTADLVVLTVLPEEYAAVLACLRDPEPLSGAAAMPNAYAWRLGSIETTQYDAPFRVAVGLGTPTTTFGALAASQAVVLFDPRYIAFVGVAGGFDQDGQRHGDVAVSSVVTAYEYGKVDTGGFAPRGNFTYPCNPALVRAAEVVRATGAQWWDDGDNPAGPPRARTGMIASGDKVIDDPDEGFFASVRAMWPKLLAVEMEGAGVAAAVHEVHGHRAVGFILVRGISDMPHRKAPRASGAAGASTSTNERDGWKVTASRNAARFLSYLVATSWPVPPRSHGDAGLPRAVDRKLPPTPAYPSAEIRALSLRLEEARARKQALLDAALPTDEVDREIVQIRRDIREGGQLRAGDALGDHRYLLIKPVGHGGFAVVWEAFDRVEQQLVAIKVLHPHLAAEPQRRERFFRGARVMLGLKHPAVVRVLDPRGEDDAFCYFVMELVPGGSLRDAVLDRRVEAARRLGLILQVGEALAEAHRRGLVHRDVKPANIVLDDGNAKLTDFDLVGAHDTTGGTRSGAMGTVVYAAPECLDRPQEATARADVFGLGMTAIFCVLGKDLLLATFRNPAATVAKLDCPDRVRAVIERAVAWEPEHRFPDAAAMVEALRAALVAEDVGAAIAAARGPRWAVASGKDEHGLWAALAINGTLQRMRWIPPGTFMMGSPTSEPGRYRNEGPQHEVTLTRGYWLGETPVAQALWVAVMGRNPSRFRGERPEDLQRPVEHVSWVDCQEFLERLNAQVAELAARLPTEAEWERACRAGTTGASWIAPLSGKQAASRLDAIAWYSTNSGGETRPVGRKAPNPYGLHDMLGNVFEWCADSFGKYTFAPAVDPVGRQGSHRVIRGGSWGNGARFLRATPRFAYEPGFRGDYVGFRLAGGPD